MTKNEKEQKTASEKQEITRRVFDIPEFGKAYNVGRSTTYEEMRSGRLKFFKVGKLTRISVESAENWRREREKTATLDAPPAGSNAKSVEVEEAAAATTAERGVGVVEQAAQRDSAA